MRSKVTIALLFLNVVLFFYIFKFEQLALPDSNGRRVFGPEIATITSLTRVTTNASTVRVTLDATKGNTWWLNEPYAWPADQNAVKSILSELQFLEHETSFPVADLTKSGQTLADFGLAEPSTTLSFDSSGKTYDVKLGKETEVGNRLYVLSTDGKRIHVVKRNFADIVKKPLQELRSNSVFSIPVFEVRSLNVQTAAPANLKVSARRDAANRWGLESPILARASKSAVEVTVNALNLLTAKRFLEPRETDLERNGLNSPMLRVTLEGNARRETLVIGNEVPAPAGSQPRPANAANTDKDYYAKIDDKSVVFTVTLASGLIDTLRTAQETLRDPRVLEFEPENVTALTITVPGQPELSLQRLETPANSTASWQVIARTAGQTPVTSPADTAVVTNLLQKLYQLSARMESEPPFRRKFLSDAPSDADIENYGFNRPEREVTLSLNTGGGTSGNEPSSIALQIGTSPDQPGRAFARTRNAPYVYEILPDIIDETSAAPRNYRQRLLRELPDTARITALRITEIPSNAAVVTATNETALNAEAIATLKVSDNTRKALTTLLSQLRTLRAKRFVSETFTPDQVDTPQGSRPWKYKLDIDLTLPGGNNAAQTSTSTLYLTDRLSGTVTLAGTTEFGGIVFELTQEMVDALFALTYAEKNDPGAPVTSSPKPEAVPTKP